MVDAVGEAAEKYTVHELAGVGPGLLIADAVASLYEKYHPMTVPACVVTGRLQTS